VVLADPQGINSFTLGPMQLFQSAFCTDSPARELSGVFLTCLCGATSTFGQRKRSGRDSCPPPRVCVWS